MPNLTFKYGTMNCSKTANLLMLAYNYKSQNKKVMILKPSIDTRFGKKIICSRALKYDTNIDLIIDPDMNYIKIDSDVKCVLVDEAQFLSEININALKRISIYCPVICYGLRTDYSSKLFTGSKRLFEIADTIKEIENICVICGNKSIINSKFCLNDNGKKIVIKQGSSVIDIGAEEKYEPLCWTCWETSEEKIQVNNEYISIEEKSLNNNEYISSDKNNMFIIPQM